VAERRLAGRFILLVEEEPLIALEVKDALHAAGARVVSAGYLDSALFTAEHPAISAAVVDLRLGQSNSMTVCRRLAHLRVPFVVYTAYPADFAASACPHVPVITKPSDPKRIVAALAQLLEGV
jgi:DNA-binding response OmpR family regulator